MQRIWAPDGTDRQGHVSPAVHDVSGLDAAGLVAQSDVHHAWTYEDDTSRWLAALERPAAVLSRFDGEVRVSPV